jgi:hypothetical protein
MLFKILKLFGLDVPAKLEAVKASLEQRVEEATDHLKQVAVGAAVVAALSAVALVTALMAFVVGLIALYFGVASAYGVYAGLGTVGGLLVVITIALAATAAVKANSMASTPTRPRPVPYAAAPAVTVAHDADLVETAAMADAAADAAHAEALAAITAPSVASRLAFPAAQPQRTTASARDLLEPLAYLLPKVMKLPTAGNPAVDELISTLAVTARGTADEAVDRAATVVRGGSRTNMILVLTGAGMVGWMLARQSRR